MHSNVHYFAQKHVWFCQISYKYRYTIGIYINMCLNPVDVKRWCGFEEKSDDKTLKGHRATYLL